MGLDNIIKLLMLFERNSLVSMHDILKVCNVSKRQAFRLINMLSDANIPIYNDRRKGGYKLVKRESYSFQSLSSIEEIYILSTLVYFFQKSADKKHFNELIEKLSLLSQNKTNEIISNFKDRLDLCNGKDNFLFHIHYTIIDYAIERQLTLRIWIHNNDISVVITKPKLIFISEWRVEDKINSSEFVKLEDIRKIEFY